MEVVSMRLTDIKPAKYNPRKDLREGDPEFEKLRASIERWTLVEPLVVNKNGNVLVGGHQRLKVCKALGIKDAQVVLVDLSPEKEKLLNMSLNKVSGDWDYLKLEELFKEFSLDDLGITGFDKREIEDLIQAESEAVESVTNNINNVDTVSRVVPPATPAAATAVELSENHPEEQNEAPATFTVYLSFPSRNVAENWLRRDGVNKRFQDGSTTIRVVMEGENYVD